MGIFGKLFGKEPEIDMAKSDANRGKMRALFDHVHFRPLEQLAENSHDWSPPVS